MSSEIYSNQVSQWKREFLERRAQVSEGVKKQAEEIKRLEPEQRVAQERICRLTVENAILEKTGATDNPERKALIDSGFNQFDVSGQCNLPGRPRTTVCDPAKYKFPYLLRHKKITRTNQLWAIDIFHTLMKRGYMILRVIMIWHFWAVMAWSLWNTMEASWVVKTLIFAFEQLGQPEIINADQGSIQIE